MIDISKLERLSCLKLEAAHRDEVINSLNGVFQMMHELVQVEVPLLPTTVPEVTALHQDEPSGIVVKEEAVSGLHLDSGYFLAPKVIKK